MSFVQGAFAEHPLRTEEQVAREVYEVALARGLDDLATVLALMCIRQESNFWCPANRRDPTSFDYPHDSESDDGRSVGYFQQQNKVPGENPTGPGENWWGPMSSRMDLKKSADVFLTRLSDDYVSAKTASVANIFIQRVQQSGVPDAYAKHWEHCWDLLRRVQAQGPIAPVPPADPIPAPVTMLRPAFTELQMFGWGASRRTRKPINFFIHTQEGSWDATARDLAEFCQGQNNVSYHYTLRDGIVYDVVDTDLYCWAVLDANVFSVNACFAGSSVTQTRQQWLDRYRFDIEIMAYLAVQDARKYGFSTEVIPPPYSGNPRPGISDHKYVTQKLGIGTHSDVGPNFPWDVFTDHVNRFATGGEDDMIDPALAQMIRDIHGAIVEPGGIPSDSPYAPDPAPRFALKDLAKFTDASSHARSVESGALMGIRSDVKMMKDAAQRGVPRAVAAWRALPDAQKSLADE